MGVTLGAGIPGNRSYRTIALGGAGDRPERQLLGHGVGVARQRPVGPDEMAGVAMGVALQVVLVLRLGLPECAGGGHFGHDLARPAAGGLDVSDGLLGNALLGLIEEEDG